MSYKKIGIVFCTVASLFFIPSFAFAVDGLIMTDSSISLSKEEPLAGDNIRIYVTLVNRGADDNRGIVKFFDGNKQVGSDQPFSILRGKTADVFSDYGNVPYGDRKVIVKVFSWPENQASATATKLFFVDRDTDKDSIPDRKDPDDDNDGVCDKPPAGECRLNADGTGDAFPLNPSEWEDTDKDGTGNNKDTDDDNDGLSDEEEKKIGTNEKKWDTDGDGASDGQDAFPLNESEFADTDGDGTGDNADPDDDNDGICDQPPAGECRLNSDGTGDALPKDATEWQDADQDGIGDNKDKDNDNDGISDEEEKKIGTDPRKSDTDGDQISDMEDLFPLDGTEWKDTDNDGMGDNKDPNNKNKGPILKYDVSEKITLFWPHTFTAEGTYDVDGTIEKIEWQLDERKIEQSSFTSFFLTPGKHYLVLTATDNAGEKREKVFVLEVDGLLYYILFFLGGGIVFFSYMRKYMRKKKH